MIETDDEALFVRYWRDRFRNDGVAACKGLCFRLLSTRVRRQLVEAAAAAEAQLTQHLTDYERKKRK